MALPSQPRMVDFSGCDGTCIAINRTGAKAGQKCGAPAKFGNPVVYCGKHTCYLKGPTVPAPPPHRPDDDAPEPEEEPLPQPPPDDAHPPAEVFGDLVSKLQDMMAKMNMASYTVKVRH